MVLPFMLFQAEIPRAFLSISAADRSATHLARAFRLRLTGSRAWTVIPGHVLGGWHDFRVDYVAKDQRFLSFDYLFTTPPPPGRMSLPDLRAKADAVRKLILPGVDDWTSREDGLEEKSMFDPPSYWSRVRRTPKRSTDPEIVVMKLEQAMGTPYMVLVRYSDTDERNSDPTPRRDILQLTLDKGEVLPP